MATLLPDFLQMAAPSFESDAGPGVSDSAYGSVVNPYSEIYAPALYQLPGFSPFYVGPGDIYSQIMSRMAQSQPPYSAGPMSSGLLGGYDPDLYARLQQQSAAQEAQQGLLDNAPIETGAGGGIDFGDFSSFSGNPADTIALGQALSAYANSTKGLAPGALVAGLLGSAITNAGINALGEMEADAAAQAAAAQSMEAVAQEAAQQAALTQGDEAIAAYDAATLAAAEAAAQAAAEAAAQEAAAIEAAQAQQAAIEAAQAEQAAIAAAQAEQAAIAAAQAEQASIAAAQQAAEQAAMEAAQQAAAIEAAQAEQAAIEAAQSQQAAIEAAQAEQAAIEAAQAEQAAIEAATNYGVTDAMAGYGESGGGYGDSFGGEAGALAGAGLAGMGLGLDSVGGLGGLGGVSGGESAAMGDVAGMGLGLDSVGGISGVSGSESAAMGDVAGMGLGLGDAAAAGGYAAADGVGASGFGSSDAGGGAGGGAKIICTKLHDLGLMPKDIYEADQAFGALLVAQSPETYAGYAIWAKHIVKWMEREDWFGAFVRRSAYAIATPWSVAMAQEMGLPVKSSWVGRALLKQGLRVCKFIGKINKVQGIQGV